MSILFNASCAGKGRDFSCAGVHVRPGDRARAFDLLRKAGNINGLCIAIPHTIDAVPLVDRLTEAGCASAPSQHGPAEAADRTAR